MKYDRSLEEVWEWKDKFYRQTKGLTMEDMVRKVEAGANSLCKQYNLHLKKVSITKK